MTEIRQPPEDLESLTTLAKGFSARSMFEEAAELFQLALRFDPDNLGLKLNLAQVRYQQKQHRGHQRDNEEALREKLRRNAIDSAHFFGLAALYEERGKPNLAMECLNIARQKDLANPYVHKLGGKMLFRRGRYQEAREELRIAQRYNPFDRETAEYLGRAEYECESYVRALEATIDAFLLLEENDRKGSRRLKERIRRYRDTRKEKSPELVDLFRDRQEKLQTAFERLELQRSRHLEQGELQEDGESQTVDPNSGRIELAGRLRAFTLWRDLDDEQIFHLTAAVHEEKLEKGQKIFDFGSQGSDLYILERGSVRIVRPTSYGDFELGSLPAGAAFGEVNFLTRGQRTADAVAAENSVLLRFETRELDFLLDQRPTLGVQVYLSFWHALAQKLRGANEQLRTFFTDEGGSEELLKLRQEQQGQAGLLEPTTDATRALLEEKGLNGQELATLANYSQVKRFPGGTYLFHEGDEGREMYVVLEGKVMITKFIPGGGEEALAILGRGDFFGEMALIDGAPRSADAKAFQGPATVVSFNEATMEEVLSIDPPAARDFMALLCRLICDRLRDIDEKVTAWRIMAGVRPQEEETQLPPAAAHPA